jgi:hypothetical protein
MFFVKSATNVAVYFSFHGHTMKYVIYITYQLI